jgi:hypothetical protein
MYLTHWPQGQGDLENGTSAEKPAALLDLGDSAKHN